MGYGSNEFNVQSPTTLSTTTPCTSSASMCHASRVFHGVAPQVVYLKGKL
jgi:hypothetical protein